ncbi:integral membrane sensor signal transduction histidine kinase [gamma proteobacterium BDW918]|nr:histidine kinase dimerization/phospho-acceptor domain-containing protein [Zhongshania aliphaticivorans]EIF43042.1 integral membrane sensor signal transduction histidine kinase [gamma proteobacterium BDW918]
MYSIERKIANRSLLVIITMMLVVALVIDQILSKWLIHEFDKSLSTKSGVLITLVKDYGDHIDFDFADEFLPEFERDIDPEYFQLWNHDGSTFERSIKLGNKDLKLLPIDITKSQLKNVVLPDGRQGRQIQTTFIPQIPDHDKRTENNLAKQTPMTLSASRETESLHELQMLVRVALFISCLIIIFSTNLLIRRIIRRGLKPIKKLSKAISDVRSHSETAKIALKECPNELIPLQNDFNHMIARLHGGFEREKAFSSNVSHELKTPISELRLLAEVASMTLDETSSAKNKEYYSDALEIALHMQKITENMLLLSRYEGVSTTLEDDINLGQLISGLISSYSKSNNASLVTWDIDIDPNIVIKSSSTEFNLILQNLVQNAAEYAVSESAIYCTWESNSNIGTGKLTISNKSHDLDQDDIAKMFDRLWRKDKARSPSNHSGLGMSIIATLCSYLKITVTARLDDQNTLHICLDNIIISNPN